jgi:hypothetical protein
MITYKCRTCNGRWGGPLVRCPRCRKNGEPLIMALNTCESCNTPFAVGLRACPNCRSQNFHEEGTVPKITVHGGATNASEAATSPAVPEDDPLGGAVRPVQGVTTPDKPAPEPEPTADVDAPEPAPEPLGPVPDISPVTGEEMTLNELRAECEKRGLPTYGTKASLRLRLSQVE